MTNKLNEFLEFSAKDVFATMLGWSVEPGSEPTPLQKQAPFSLCDINGSIGFGGQFTGSLFFSVPTSLGQKIGRQILGDSVGDAEISDVIGELTNMMAGGCKSRLCDSGCTVVMSIPNIIRGNQIWAHGRDVELMVRRDFRVAAVDERFQVIMLGKME